MRQIQQRISGHAKDIGFPVRRLLPAARARTVGPFVFFDHMGPLVFQGQVVEDVRPHPHIGLATVTYLLSGAMMHRDHLGSEQLITPGDINWMRSGRGIVHSERIPAEYRKEGTVLEGLQMWVALPQSLETSNPEFVHYPQSMIPAVTKDGFTAHILIGSACEMTSPVVPASPTLYMTVEMTAGSRFVLDTHYPERAAYVISGEIAIEGDTIARGELVTLEAGSDVTIHATGQAHVMILGGEPLDGERFVWWNFVSSDKDRIEKARQAWADDDQTFFPAIKGETERIPLPSK